MYYFDAVSSGLCLVAVTRYILYLSFVSGWRRSGAENCFLRPKIISRHTLLLEIKGASCLEFIICLYFVSNIAKTTNMSTNNHDILKGSCRFLGKQVCLHIYCNQNRNNHEYGDKNTANMRVLPQYDSVVWQLAFPTRIG